MTHDLDVVVCDHGLGHARRVFAVLSDLIHEHPNLSARVFASKQQLARLLDWPLAVSVLRSVHPYPFESHTSKRALMEGEPISVKWVQRLPELSARVAWSDNLLAILDVRPDALISGSFFWHEVVEAKRPDAEVVYRDRARLQEHNPSIIGSRYFSTPEVSQAAGFKPVGVYRYHAAPTDSKGTDLYLGAGSDEKLRLALRTLLRNLAYPAGVPDPFMAWWVESEVLPENPPWWIRRADYSDEMFASVACGCVRPGLGIVNDLLSAGARVFSVDEGDDSEMTHNSETLVRLNVGEVFKNYSEAIEAAFLFYQHPGEARQNHQNAISGLQLDGVRATAAEVAARL